MTIQNRRRNRRARASCDIVRSICRLVRFSFWIAEGEHNGKGSPNTLCFAQTPSVSSAGCKSLGTQEPATILSSSRDAVQNRHGCRTRRLWSSTLGKCRRRDGRGTDSHDQRRDRSRPPQDDNASQSLQVDARGLRRAWSSEARTDCVGCSGQTPEPPFCGLRRSPYVHCAVRVRVPAFPQGLRCLCRPCWIPYDRHQ